MAYTVLPATKTYAWIPSATVVIGDFNAASPSWGYNYYNALE